MVIIMEKLKRRLKRKNEQELGDVELSKLDVYLALPSDVRNYLVTGLNRVTIKSMLDNLTAQKDLEKVGKTDWVMIATAAVMACLGLAILIKFGAGALPDVANAFNSVNQVPPQRIAP